MLSFQEIKEGQIRLRHRPSVRALFLETRLPVLKRSGGHGFGHNIPAGLETSPAKHYTGLDLDQWGWCGCEHPNKSNTYNNYNNIQNQEGPTYPHNIQKHPKQISKTYSKRIAMGHTKTKIWPFRNEAPSDAQTSWAPGWPDQTPCVGERNLAATCLRHALGWEFSSPDITRHHHFCGIFATGNHIFMDLLFSTSTKITRI